MKDKMTFFRSFYDAVKDLPDEQFATCVKAILEYGLNDNEINVSAIAKVVMTLVKPVIDNSNKNYSNGKKGGRPRKETKETTASENEKGGFLNSETSGYENEKPDKDIGIRNKEQEKDSELGTKDNNPLNPPAREKRTKKSKESDTEILLDQSTLSEPLKDKTRDWLKYKAEKRQTYKPQGLKSLLSKLAKEEQEAGSIAVMDLIDDCMANGYQGIIWDRLERRQQGSRDRPKSVSFLDL